MEIKEITIATVELDSEEKEKIKEGMNMVDAIINTLIIYDCNTLECRFGEDIVNFTQGDLEEISCRLDALLHINKCYKDEEDE